MGHRSIAAQRRGAEAQRRRAIASIAEGRSHRIPLLGPPIQPARLRSVPGVTQYCKRLTCSKNLFRSFLSQTVSDSVGRCLDNGVVSCGAVGVIKGAEVPVRAGSRARWACRSSARSVTPLGTQKRAHRRCGFDVFVSTRRGSDSVRERIRGVCPRSRLPE